MEKYRKKPVVIEAVKLEKTYSSMQSVHEFMNQPVNYNGNTVCQEKFHAYCDTMFKNEGLIIQTLEGEHLARWNDMIIKGVHGEFYPCKPEIFEKTYEKVQEQDNSEVNLSHVQIVMSFRLRREIENLHKRNWYYSADKIYAEQMLERLSKAISCEEISEI